MSRGLGKLQLELLDILGDIQEDGEFYSHTVYWLVDRTGKQQQSISRAMNNLVAKGLVVKRWTTNGAMDNLPKRCAEYILADKLEEHDALMAEWELGREERAEKAWAAFKDRMLS